MITILSPAKNLNFNKQNVTSEFTIPEFVKNSEKIVKKLNKLTKQEIGELLNINPKLANINFDRYHQWKLPFTSDNAKQAVMAFNGDVYFGLKAKEFKESDLKFAQDHLFILSGLYGILKPLDLIQPYRLEMGTKFAVNGSGDLYKFWVNKITGYLKNSLKDHKENVLINLASNEYTKAINFKKLGNIKTITPVFKELKDDTYRIFFVFLKRARGMMARYIIENRIDRAEDIKGFDSDGYFFNQQLSTEIKWVFTR